MSGTMSDSPLTHGWEPGCPADDSLLRRFVLGSADRGEVLARAAGGRADRWPELAGSDPASPVLFDNAAVLLQPPTLVDLDDVVGRMLEWYPADRPMVLLSAWPTPDLSGHGLELMGHPPLMFRPAGGGAPDLPPGLEVVRVETPVQLTDFLDTIVDAYPMPDAGGSPLGAAAVLAEPSIHLFVGYLDGAPVATSGSSVEHGVIDVEWVACRPEARGRGIGAALTWAATLVEPGLPAVLIASDDGQPVYEAMGFVRLLRLTMWHRPPVAS